tara:strand:- start:358 stop:621 length:264 start_codon:yes stop_codon:yes gene_type:complete
MENRHYNKFAEVRIGKDCYEVRLREGYSDSRIACAVSAVFLYMLDRYDDLIKEKAFLDFTKERDASEDIGSPPLGLAFLNHLLDSNL